MIVANAARTPSAGPDSNGRMLTAEEFDAIENWTPGYQYELIHGVLIVNPPPDFAERGPNDELGYLIRHYRQSHPNGRCVDATAFEQTVRVGENRRRCDRAIWIGLGRLPDERVDVPRIVIEFPCRRMRDRQRDYVVKRRESAEAGIAEYWILDLRQRRFVVHRGLTESLELGGGDIYESPWMPGFRLSIDALLPASGLSLETNALDGEGDSNGDPV